MTITVTYNDNYLVDIFSEYCTSVNNVTEAAPSVACKGENTVKDYIGTENKPLEATDYIG